jgi:hypothetical protein
VPLLAIDEVDARGHAVRLLSARHTKPTVRERLTSDDGILRGEGS